MDLIYATTNKHKLTGAKQALTGTNINLIAPDKTLPDVPEIQSNDQQAVSIDKALKYYNLLKRPLVVMDSGLFIDELNGFPGVYTKYALDTIGIDRIIQLLGGGARAYTQRTITYFDGNKPQTFTLKLHGVLLKEPRGDNGHNYDKYFLPDSKNKTLAEMASEEKAELTAEIWRKLAAWLQKSSK
ncbi:MAG: non-canonical purine NTP pyrophosphatase [Candidatus Saccharimonas sp.]